MKVALQSDDAELVLERVAFDSEIFGFGVARIVTCTSTSPAGYARLHREGVERARERGFRHVSRRIPGDADDERRGLEQSGYSLVDVGVVFERDLGDVTFSPFSSTRLASEADVELVARECASIFRTSRYYHDPAFSPELADELHRRSIWNSFRGRAAAFIVAEEATAFVTCAVSPERVGSIGLLGVSPGSRGRGVGHRLLSDALAWFASTARAERVEVKTQVTNTSAVRTYERAGFRLARVELTYGCAVMASESNG